MIRHRGNPRQIGESIILETGQPDKNNASAFSRFVLPFRWRANPVPGRRHVKAQDWRRTWHSVSATIGILCRSGVCKRGEGQMHPSQSTMCRDQRALPVWS
jgi:hypothetical protein